jgi:site-specific DNA-methyltransferase (adenine-specific)
VKPYYDHAGITIYHGDCRELLPSITADVLVTDPPYGINKAEWDSEFLFPTAPIGCIAAAVMPGVWNILACPVTFGSLTYRGTLAAYLCNGMTRGPIGFGNWIPCLLYAADGVSLWKQDGDCKSFVVGDEPLANHPSPKPMRVVRWFVDRMPPGTVLDPFMGSGTTLRAAKDLGRKAIGIEIEERYCEIAARRLSQEVMNLEGPTPCAT